MRANLLLLAALFAGLSAPAKAQFVGGFNADPSMGATLGYTVGELAGGDTATPVPNPCLAGPTLLFDQLRGDNALTDEQSQKLCNIENDAMSKIEVKAADLKSQQRALVDLLTAPQTDKAQIKTVQGQINAQKAAIADVWLDAQLSSLDLLTPQQKQALKMIMIKNRNRKHHFVW